MQGPQTLHELPVFDWHSEGQTVHSALFWPQLVGQGLQLQGVQLQGLQLVGQELQLVLFELEVDEVLQVIARAMAAARSLVEVCEEELEQPQPLHGAGGQGPV